MKKEKIKFYGKEGGLQVLWTREFIASLFVFFNFFLLKKAKEYYDFGEDEEFKCHTGFDLEGFQFITCRPDGTWTQPKGKCVRKSSQGPKKSDTLGNISFCSVNFHLEISFSVPLGNLCLPPEIPDGMTLFPYKNEYKVGESVGVNCNQVGLFLLPQGFYKCGNSLTWEPPLPADLRCTSGTVYC